MVIKKKVYFKAIALRLTKPFNWLWIQSTLNFGDIFKYVNIKQNRWQNKDIYKIIYSLPWYSNFDFLIINLTKGEKACLRLAEYL